MLSAGQLRVSFRRQVPLGVLRLPAKLVLMQPREAAAQVRSALTAG